jgi:N-acylneuraminate cytidylyltransferase
MNVAIIPARGGSKRIPRKNIRDFCGRPMLAWSIETAQQSGCFGDIIVSTDDPEIANIATTCGASVPFFRPNVLSDDSTATIPVIQHAIEWLLAEGRDIENACCIYATAPLLLAGDIRRGLDALTSYQCDYAFSVTRFSFPIQRAIRIKANGMVEMLHPENFDVRSQDLEETYHDAGQFYWGKVSAWLAGLPIFSSRSLPVILPNFRVQDIDTQEDWVRAELLFQVFRSKDNANE